MPLEKSSPYAVPNVFPVSIPKPPQTNSSLAHLTSSNTSQTVNATKTPSDSLRPLSYIPSWYQTLSSQCNNPSLIRNLDVAATLSARSNATSIYDPLSSTAKPSVPPKNTDGDTPPQRSKPKSWSNEEDTLLIKLRSMGLSWTEVAKHFPGKSRKACSSRFDRISLETNMLANAQMNPNCSAFDSSATKPVSKMASSQTIQSANTGFNKIKISKTQTRSVMSKYESQIRTGSQPKQPPSTKLTNPTLPQMPSLNAVTGMYQIFGT
ncbi:hypothetical protein BKA69DRAFT_59177 [Paraphysoderma sedebokerense]|nr:hypothetical protein BKA69DRAFT_59177 [Paraphysoderma sedebokerense]